MIRLVTPTEKNDKTEYLLHDIHISRSAACSVAEDGAGEVPEQC